MKLFEASHLFSHPWSLITFANWKKYPNEYSPHVESVDVLERHIDEEGVIHTQRLVCCKQPLPALLSKLGFSISDSAYFLETSTLDPKTQVYEAKTVNLSMRSIMIAEETCVFKPTANQHTLFSQSVKISAAPLGMIARIVEDAAVSRFQANAMRGKLALESVLDSILNEKMFI